MKRQPIRSKIQASRNRLPSSGLVSLTMADTQMLNTHNWVIMVEFGGLDNGDSIGKRILIPELSPENFRIERLDSNPNVSLVLAEVKWQEAPYLAKLSVFVNARENQFGSSLAGEHFIRLVSFPGREIDLSADTVPLYLTSHIALSDTTEEPALTTNYLAKDFESIRALLETNINRQLPNWRDKSPADIGTMIVEILAYIADYLSYRQDFTANEAYLHTARLRKSLMRHARLLGYFTDEGCAARTVLAFDVSAELEIPDGLAVLSNFDHNTNKVISRQSDLFAKMINAGAACYETSAPLTARPELNRLRIHDFGMKEFTLYAGSTSAVLELPNGVELEALPLQSGRIIVLYKNKYAHDHKRETDLFQLQAHPVLLTRVDFVANDISSALGKSLIRVYWAAADALPSDMPVTFQHPTDKEQTISTAFAHANVVTAQYGLTRSIELDIANESVSGDWQTSLRADPLYSTNNSLTDNALAMADVLNSTPGQLTCAAITLHEHPLMHEVEPESMIIWRPTRDLLRHGISDRVFSVDKDDNHSITLRFGKDGLGRTPSLNSRYTAFVREATTANASVGANALHVAAPEDEGTIEAFNAHLSHVNNPIAALPSRPAESDGSIRHKAPEVVRKTDTCATEGDYEKLAEHVGGVKAAKAWHVKGEPWPQIQIAILANTGYMVDQNLLAKVKNKLDTCRPLGRQLIVTGPTPIPLEIKLEISVGADQVRLEIERKILEVVGNSVSQVGLFSAPNIGFNQTLYASAILSAVRSIASKSFVRLSTFRKAGASGPRASEYLTFEKGEIPLLGERPDEPADGYFSIKFIEAVEA